MNDPMRKEITIGFECTDTLGGHHKAESTVPIYRHNTLRANKDAEAKTAE